MYNGKVVSNLIKSAAMLLAFWVFAGFSNSALAQTTAPVEVKFLPETPTAVINQNLLLEVWVNPNNYDLTYLDIKIDTQTSQNCIGRPVRYERDPNNRFVNNSARLSGTDYIIEANMGTATGEYFGGNTQVRLGTLVYTAGSTPVSSSNCLVRVTRIRPTSRQVLNGYTPVATPPTAQIALTQPAPTPTPIPTGTPIPTNTPTPGPTSAPTPTLIPTKPNLTSPNSQAEFTWGQNFQVPFSWTQMRNPPGQITRVGLRVVKAQNENIRSSEINCSDKVVLDHWWIANLQAHSGTVERSGTNLKTCGDQADSDGITYLPLQANDNFVVEGVSDNSFPSGGTSNFTLNKSLEPGRYFLTVFNYVNDSYTCHQNCTGVGAYTGDKQGASVKFISSHYFNVVCAQGTSWSGQSCIGPTSTPSPTPIPDVNTTGFKIAESTSLDGADIKWDELLIIPQDQYTGKYPYEFKAKICKVDDTDCVPFPRGIRNVCVKFYYSNNTSSDVSCSSIGLVPKPVINSVSCNLSSSGVGTVVTIKGANFGTNLGAIKIGSKTNSLEKIDVPAGGWTDNQVVANLNSQLEGGKIVRLTVAEDYSAKDSLCQIGLSQISFKASLACRSLDKPLTSAELEVSDLKSDESVYKNDKNTFDAGGIPVGLFPKIEEGRDYKISIRAPGTLKRTILFRAARGTTVLSAFNLPVGDISPEIGDGLINARDFSTLKSQWTLTSDTQKRADLNLDGRVNSLDYSCLVSNFNKSSEEVDQRPKITPTPGLPVGGIIIPSPTASAGIGTTEPGPTTTLVLPSVTLAPTDTPAPTLAP